MNEHLIKDHKFVIAHVGIFLQFLLFWQELHPKAMFPKSVQH